MHDLGRWIGALGAAAVVALTCGCSGGSDPSTLPDVTPHATTLPAESPSPTTEPSADPTAELTTQAIDFYLRYETVSEESWSSRGALDARRTMFVDSCTTCLAGYEFASRAHEDGLTFVGEPLPDSKVDVASVSGDTVTLLVQSDVPAGQLEDENGKVVERFEANPNVQIVVEVRRVEGEFVILKEEVL